MFFEIDVFGKYVWKSAFSYVNSYVNQIYIRDGKVEFFP